MSWGNYYISYEQIPSVKVRRLKLFTQLEVPYNNTHEDDICCETELNDNEVDFMDNCFEMVDTISLNTKSTLYYISGYIAMKERIGLDEPNSINSNISEITTNVSSGLLKHPSDDLLDLSFYLYAYYDAVETKDCINRLLKAFKQIYEVIQYEFENPSGILRRYANCFSKGAANQQTQKIKDDKRSSIQRKICYI